MQVTEDSIAKSVPIRRICVVLVIHYERLKTTDSFRSMCMYHDRIDVDFALTFSISYDTNLESIFVMRVRIDDVVCSCRENRCGE